LVLLNAGDFVGGLLGFLLRFFSLHFSWSFFSGAEADTSMAVVDIVVLIFPEG
jgi:hypothetical protein